LTHRPRRRPCSTAACWTRQRRGYNTAVCTTPSLRRYDVTTTTATAAIVAVFVGVAAADAVAAAAASVADYNDGSGGDSADTHHTYAYTVAKTTAAARERGAQRITTRRSTRTTLIVARLEPVDRSRHTGNENRTRARTRRDGDGTKKLSENVEKKFANRNFFTTKNYYLTSTLRAHTKTRYGTMDTHTRGGGDDDDDDGEE